MKRNILFIFLTLLLILGLMPVGAAYALPEGVPGAVEKAAIEKVEVLNDSDGVPYFQLEIQFPQSFLNLSEACPAGGYTWIDYYWKIDGGSWEYLSGGTTECLFGEGYGFAVAGKTNTYRVPDIYPEDEGGANAIVIKNHVYTIKAQLAYAYPEGENGTINFVRSPFSNEVSIGSGSFYQKASDWATSELQNAYDLGLIPDILKGADMTKPITREEFCELAVLLYEKTTGKTSEPVTPNPFKDTTNQQILKAFKLGITTGTSDTAFSPNLLINREECAAMLFRTIKVIQPNGDFGISGVKDFPDQKYISNWAVAAAKYMSRIGIITGDSQGNFMPKATTTVQKAAGYGMATREQAIAMTVRTLEKVKS